MPGDQQRAVHDEVMIVQYRRVSPTNIMNRTLFQAGTPSRSLQEWAAGGFECRCMYFLTNFVTLTDLVTGYFVCRKTNSMQARSAVEFRAGPTVVATAQMPSGSTDPVVCGRSAFCAAILVTSFMTRYTYAIDTPPARNTLTVCVCDAQPC